ncbi:hypothetical protein D9M69_559460 [compost metagenome]
MGGRRNQANVAISLPTTGVIRTDGEQPRVFALRAGIGLQRHSVVTGCRAEHLLQLLDQLLISLGLFGWRERMQGAKLGPGDRDHLAGGVELHGA